MEISQKIQMPELLGNYVNLVENSDLSVAFEQSIVQIDQLDMDLFERIGSQTYAAGKWTINELIGHLIDWERIFCFRALMFSRGMLDELDGYDEQQMGGNSNANSRSLQSLIEELRLARLSSQALFMSFDMDLLSKNGICSNRKTNVRSLGFSIIGHQIHHFKVIEERYYPLGEN